MAEMLVETLIEGAKEDSVMTNPTLAINSVLDYVSAYTSEWVDVLGLGSSSTAPPTTAPPTTAPPTTAPPAPSQPAPPAAAPPAAAPPSPLIAPWAPAPPGSLLYTAAAPSAAAPRAAATPSAYARLLEVQRRDESQKARTPSSTPHASAYTV
jgi:hypothetical protein